MRAPLLRPAAAITLLLAATFSLSSCSGEAAFDSIRAAHGTADRVRAYDSWDELMAHARDTGQDSVDVAVVGTVTNVEEGRSSRWGGTENGDREVLDFGDPRAMSSTYHLDVTVASVVGTDDPEVKPDAVLRVGVALDPQLTLEEVKADFLGPDQGLFFLQRSPVFDYEDGMLGIVEDGALIALPDGEGHLSFPMLPDSDAIQPPEGTKLPTA